MLTGLWHGASYNFVLWGLFYALILLLEKLILGKLLNKLPKFVQWIYAFVIINIGWLIFRLENLNDIKIALINLFSLKKSDFINYILNNVNTIYALLFVVIGLIFMFPVLNIFKKYK